MYAQIGGKYSHLAHILASLTLCLALPCMKWTCLVLGPVRFAEKTNRNTVPADLLGEKNTVPAQKKNKVKNTDYKTNEQGQENKRILSVIKRPGTKALCDCDTTSSRIIFNLFAKAFETSL